MPKTESRRPWLEDAFRLNIAYWASVENFLRRYWGINLQYYREALDILAPSKARPYFDSERPKYAAISYVNYLTELSMIPWLALGQLGIELDKLKAEPSSKRMYLIKEENGEFSLNDNEGTPLLLPVRIRDASEGILVYSANANYVQSILDSENLPFSAVRYRGDKTLLVIFIVKYKEGDLGAHDELGASFLVVPKKQPSASPGLYIYDLPVNSGFSNAAGSIWGYPKSLAKLEFNYLDRSVEFKFARNDPAHTMLQIKLPRGGSGSTTEIPFYTYTMKDDNPHRTIYTRSGRGEWLRSGGEGVEVVLGEEEHHEGDSLWKILNDIGIDKRKPILHAWTEHMSGEFSVPYALK